MQLLILLLNKSIYVKNPMSNFRTRQNLNDQNFNQQTGDTLTLAGNVAYGVNPSRIFSKNTLANVGYVTGITSTASISGATNGLNTINRRIRLGGSLINDTTIDVNTRVLSFVDNVNSTGISIDPQVVGGSILLAHAYVGDLEFKSTGLIFSDTRATKRGIQYESDYSGGFNSRSLVDAGFVTGITSLFIVPSGATFAGNGLNKQGRIIRLGGNITGNTLINLSGNSLIFSATTGTLRYGGNYSSNYTSRSLVDAGYVTGITSQLTGSVTGGTNGLSVQGKNIRLGGIITGSTTIGLGTNILTFTGSTGHLRYGSDVSANYTNRSLVDKGYVDNKIITNLITGVTASNGLTEVGADIKLGGKITGATTIGLDTNILTFTASTGTLRYGGNYSANFTSRSLVDKGYVTGLTSQLTPQAGNGLNAQGQVVRLGGRITGATTIGLAANILTFTGSTGHLRYGSNLSSNFTALSIPDVSYVSGITSQAITGATNGLTKLIKKVELGGALQKNTLIDGVIDGTKFETGFPLNGIPLAGGYLPLSTCADTQKRLYVVGYFINVNGFNSNHIVRLKSNHIEVDTSFNSGGTGFNNYTNVVITDSQDRIYVGGTFTTYNGISAVRLVRINPNGSIDNTFDLTTGFGGTQSGAATQIYHMALNSDESVLYVGGDFSTYKSVSANGIVGINTSDGSRNSTFNIGSGFVGAIINVVVDANDKIYASGPYSVYNGVGGNNRLIRLNPNGSKDTGFDNSIGFAPGDGDVGSISFDSNGDLYCTGRFTSYKGVAANGIIKLKPDGSIDNTFVGGSGFAYFNDWYYSILDRYDRLYVFAPSLTYKGVTRTQIFRILPNGDLDLEFYSGGGIRYVDYDGVYGPVNAVYNAAQTRMIILDDALIMPNSGNLYDGVRVSRIVLKINTSSNILQFKKTLLNYERQSHQYYTNRTLVDKEYVDNTITTTQLLGSTSALGSETWLGTNPNLMGSASPTDTVFIGTGAGSGASGATSSIAIGAGSASGSTYAFNSIFIGTSVGQYSTHASNSIFIGSNTGNYDAVMNSGGTTSILIGNNTTTGGFSDSIAIGTYAANTANYQFAVGASYSYWQIAGIDYLMPTSSALGGGYVLTNDGAGVLSWEPSLITGGTNGLNVQGKNIRLGGELTGSTALIPSNIIQKKSTFDIGTGFGFEVRTITIQNDNKFLVGGSFTTFTGSTNNGLIRLNPNGTKDTTFNIGNGFAAGGIVYQIVQQPDNKLIIGGDFNQFTGGTAAKMIRLNSNGTKDSTFNVGIGFNNQVRIVKLQSDNKIIVGGMFTTYTGSTNNKLIRLNSNGTKDSTFNVGTGFAGGDAMVSEIQSDNKILVGGTFTTFTGSTNNRLIRLNSNGTKDSTFNIGTGFNGDIYALKLQSDGKILVGGAFSTFTGSTNNKLIRLNSNGTKDSTFNVGTGFDGIILGGIQVQTDGKILVGGSFTTFTGTTNNRLIRLNTNGTKDNTFNIGTGFNSYITDLKLTSDDSIIVGGHFITYNNTSNSRLIFLNKTIESSLSLTNVRLSYNNTTDFNENYTSNSIPDVGFVTGITSQLGGGGITGGTNGLTTDGANLKLGGTLTEYTLIDSNSQHAIEFYSTGYYIIDNSFEVMIKQNQDYGVIDLDARPLTGGTIYLRAGNKEGVIILTTEGNDGVIDILNVGENSSITIGNRNSGHQGVRFDLGYFGGSYLGSYTDHRTGSTRGIQYASDYSTISTNPRTLVDKAYVTGLTSSLNGSISGIISGSTHQIPYKGTNGFNYSNNLRYIESDDKFIGSTSISTGGTQTFTWGDLNNNKGRFGSAMFGELSEIATNVGSALAAGEGVYISAYGGHSMGRGTVTGGIYSWSGGIWIPDTTIGKTNPKTPRAMGTASFAFYSSDGSQTDNHGSNAPYGAILGGVNHHIASGNTGAAIIGGNGIKLTGTTYQNTTAVPSLAVFTTPSSGGSDDLLTWNATTKKVGKVTQASIGGGGSGTITGGTNGLSVQGKNIRLGGTLTGNTFIDGNNNIFQLYGSAGAALITSSSSYMGVDGNGVKLQTTLTTTISSQNIELNSPFITVSGDSLFEGVKYFTDYSANYTDRSLVDKGYINTLIFSGTGTTEAGNGLSRQGTIVRLGGTLTGSTIITDSRGTKLGIQYDNDYSLDFTARSLVDAGYVTGITSQLGGGSGSYVEVISGDTTTTGFTITHNKNTRSVMVQVDEYFSPYMTIYPTVYKDTVNTVYITFASPPSNGEVYNVIVI